MAEEHGRLLRYGAALALVALALQLALLLQPYLKATPDAPFFAAVAVASWFGGLWPGLAATITAALAVDYFLIPPLHAIDFDANHIVRLATFSVVSLLISGISHGLRVQRKRAEQRELDAQHELAVRKRVEAERVVLLEREREARQQAEAAQRRLASLADAAQEANRMKDEFLATVSHELRTPLHAILGWSRLLRSGTLNQEAADRALDTIERNAQAQSQLVGDILDVSRIVTGKLHLELVPVSLGQVIGAALDSVRPAAQAKAIRLERTVAQPAVTVMGDPGRLQQIVWNLLSNAIKFTPAGGCVQVDVRRANHSAEITVKDTGIGIDREFLPYVFDRFRQADSSTSRSHGGLGLGLAIVRHLAEAHGGSACVESEGPGRGAMFTVRLPAVKVSGEVAALRPTPTESGPKIPVLDGVRVLAVDDQEDARELIAASLQRYGAMVSTAASTRSALELIDVERPDVLIGDIGMPDEDGYALIRKLRERPAEHGGRTPAIALTAYARREDRERVLAAGFQVHLAKPIADAELLHAVAALAGRRMA